MGKPALQFDVQMPSADEYARLGRFDFETMKVGESFVFPVDPAIPVRTNYDSARTIIMRANEYFAPKHFIAYLTPEGLRCWRNA